MSSFGHRLRQLRLEAGMSQGQLAGEDLSASYISLLEADKRTPSSEVVLQLANRLNCTPARLVDGQPTDRERQIELELAYAQLALEHGEAWSARDKLSLLLERTDLDQARRDDASLLLGYAQEKLGDRAAAVKVLLPLLERGSRGETHLPLCDVAMALSNCYRDTGDVHRAISVGEQGLAAARQQGLAGSLDYFRLAATVMLAYLYVGDFVHATTWAESLIAEAEAAGDRGAQAALYWNAAIAAQHDGRIDEALRLTRRAMGHLSELENTRDLARLRVEAASILLAADPPRTDEATVVLDRTREELESLGSSLDLAEWAFLKSTAALHDGDLTGAERYAKESLARLDIATPVEFCRANLALADALAAQGRLTEAARACDQAQLALEASSGGRVSAALWRDLAERRSVVGDLEAVAACYRRALDSAAVHPRNFGAVVTVRRMLTETPQVGRFTDLRIDLHQEA